MRRALKLLVIYPLLFAAAAGGVLYAAYQQPQLRPYLQPHWQNFVEHLRGYLPPPAEISANKTARTDSAKDSPPVSLSSESTERAAAADSEAADNAAPFDDSSAAENVARDSADFVARDEFFAAQIARLQDEIARLRERENRRIDAPDADVRLDLIDLRLRIDGDPAAAADALSALPNVRGVDPRWRADEIARLQTIASRGQIAETLRKLSRIFARAASAPSAFADAAAEDSWSGRAAAALKRIFNVRRIPAGGENGESAGAQLRRMEMLLLTGQRTAYLAALHEFAARPPSAADANLPLLIQTLQKFGAPKYALAQRKPR